MIRLICLAAVLLLSDTCAATAVAGKFNKVLSAGDQAPAFKGLMGTDDQSHNLNDYKEAKLLLVVFTCNHCPVAQAYQRRLIQIQDDYQAKGLQVVAVSVSKLPADTLDKMKQQARSQGYNFPYLHDASQKSGRAYGASVTPQAFLLNADRKVAYMGSIDDSQDANDVQRHYLREAIEAVLAGKQPEVKETRPQGCSIEYLP